MEIMQWYERDITLEQAMDGIETNMRASVRNYIAVGFYLKAIRDRKLYLEADYKNFEEFVRDKYDRDKGWASRCIKVNDQLSKDGNSPVLAEEYREYKVSQLVELAYLTGEQRMLVSPDMTVKQLQAIRKPEVVISQPDPEPETQMTEGQLDGEIKIDETEKVVTLQPESDPEVIHFTAGNRTIDNAYGAMIAAAVREYLDSGYARPEKECEVAALGLTYKVLKRQDITVFYTDTGRTVFDVENARLEEEYQYWNRNKGQPEPSGESQTGPEPPRPEQTHPEKSGKCIHRPEFDCTLEEAHKLTPGTGENCSQACCWDCVRRGDCKLECYSSERRPEVVPEERGGESAAEVQQEVEVQQEGAEIPSQEECILDFYQNHMSRQCAQAVKDGDAKVLRQELISNHGEPHDSGATGDGFYNCNPERIHFQDNMCETFLSLTWGKYVKELLSLIGSAEDEASEHGNGVPDMSETEDTVIDGEFTEIPEMKEDIVNPPPKPEQPELPALKNNEQRAAFVDAYETWPLWIETKQTGERYYRYYLEDGTSMVVKVYHARIFDGYASGSYEAQYHDGYGRHEYYLLQQGKFFRDCETNRGLLIEKLKEIQKVKKG